MTNISKQTDWLLAAYKKDYSKPVPKNVEKIKLSHLVSKLGFIYEKFRSAIDYNEEHLVRRNSLERFLRRHILFLQERRAPKIAKDLVYDFIRARYLPNETLPETIISELAQFIDKYLTIIQYINDQKYPDGKKLILWIISLMACEIDEFLFPDEKETAVINYMYSHLIDNLAFINCSIDEREKNLQIYIAVLRTLVKADQTLIRYRLLKLYMPNWSLCDKNDIRSFCKSVVTIKRKLDTHLSHPYSFQLSHIIRPQSVFFTILKQIFDKDDTLEATLANPDLLEEKVEAVCSQNYHRIRNKLIGSSLRVILYILFTKTILAFILELPYDKFVAGEINWNALTINVVFHPILMLFVAMTIKIPGIKNTKIIVEEIKKIIYGEERKVVFKPKRSLRRGSFSYLLLNFVYLLMFGFSFGAILYVLHRIKFNLLSGALFIFFLTVISFFGFRLRTLAKQLYVLPRKDNLFNFLIDFISLPIIRVGRFVSTNFSKVNIFLYILDFIIETPLKIFITFSENTMNFIREKRDETIE
ncbi:MAG: hypothetical protein WCL61_01815 [bacterium]